MPDRFTPEEFDALMSPWDRRERSIIDERMRTSYTRERLEQFSEDEARTMRAMLERLIPQSEAIDLAGFIDWAAGRPLGRGDKAPGALEEVELFHKGLAAIDATAEERHGARFDLLDAEKRDALLGEIQRGETEGDLWSAISSALFFKRFYSKALHGYFAHPRAWMRIGFPGASYPEGYVWVGLPQVKQRHDRQTGWETL
jgi:hypothetical protein